MAGVPPRANLSEILPGLFQNKVVEVPVGTELGTRISTFSRFKPTADQISQLVYPDGFTPIGFYIVYQVTIGDEYTIRIVSFAEQQKYLYGFYFDVVAQAKLDDELLRTSKKAVSLSPVARFITSQYMELYVRVGRTATILGLHTNDPSIASVQYSQSRRYFYANLETDGLQPGLSKIRLTGLSRNLQR